MKIKRPQAEKFRKPETPTWIKLLIAGLACLTVGIERRLFLLVGAGLLVAAWLSARSDSQRLTPHQ